MVIINVEKAKLIAHGIRRTKREEEFAPLDAIIMKQIPGNSLVEAEASRQVVRDKYATMQADINSATTVDEIKSILG